MNKDPDPQAPDDLSARIARARALSKAGGKEMKETKLGKPSSGMGVGFRIGTEMIAALMVGVGIGLFLDKWLDTEPWFMVVFFFLGSAAGLLNVYRVVSGIGMAPGYLPPEDGKDGPGGPGERDNGSSG